MAQLREHKIINGMHRYWYEIGDRLHEIKLAARDDMAAAQRAADIEAAELAETHYQATDPVANELVESMLQHATQAMQQLALFVRANPNASESAAVAQLQNDIPDTSLVFSGFIRRARSKTGKGWSEFKSMLVNGKFRGLD